MPQRLNEETARAMIRKQVEAWNRGDLNFICNAYTDDAISVTPEGCVEGRENIRALYEEAFRDQSRKGVVYATVEKFDLLTTFASRGQRLASMVVYWQRRLPDGRLLVEGRDLCVLREGPEGEEIFICYVATVLSRP